MRREFKRVGAVLAVVAGAWIGAIANGTLTAPVAAQAGTARIWEGVYTSAQADRGKATYSTACVRCHGADLAGTTAPSLAGDRFLNTWGGEPIDRLFAKIRDTMPPNFGTILDDSAKLEIVTYILQANGYPAGPRELPLTGDVLTAVQILRKGEQARVQNFSLVETVGCLARGPNNSWVLTRTSNPTATRDDAPAPAALAAAAAKPLGTETFLLLSAAPFAPETHQGQKMEARGLVYTDAGDARLTLTSLQRVGSCE